MTEMKLRRNYRRQTKIRIMKTSAQAFFESWIDGERRRRNLSWEMLSERLGVSRQTIQNWRNKPESLSPCIVAGIVYILGVDDADLDQLCKQFGIDRYDDE